MMIRYLELESERLRQFYTKKIENLQKKYQSQLHAFKRGGTSAVQESDEISRLLSQLTTENTHLSEKINVLEEELLQTAEELGRVKAIHSTTTLSTSTSTTPVEKTETPSTELMNRVHQLENEILKLQQTPSPSSPPETQCSTSSVLHSENLIKELRLNLKDTLEMQNKYLFQINELTQNCSELQSELIFYQTKSMSQQQQTLSQTSSPKMTQFLIMEQKLNEVEGRLQRRETELLKLLEENKMTGNMERMRLQSLHEQVTRT